MQAPSQCKHVFFSLEIFHKCTFDFNSPPCMSSLFAAAVFLNLNMGFQYFDNAVVCLALSLVSKQKTQPVAEGLERDDL